MPGDAAKTLAQILKRKTFDGAYYLCGEDEFQKEDATKKLIAAGLDPAVRDFNLDVLRGSEVDPKSFDGIVSSLPMMSDCRVVVIRDAGGLKKDAKKAVLSFLTKPSSSVMVLLVESVGGKKDNDFANLATLLEFTPLTPEEIPGWISHWVSRELSVEISSGAIELLHSAVGNDLHQMVMELDKLASFSGNRMITEDAVAAVVGVRRGETMVDLLDAIGRRDVKTSLDLLDHVLAQPKTTGVQIVMLLATQTVALAWGRAKLDEGIGAGRLQGEYFSLLKQSGSAYTGRPWGTAAAAWTRATNAWDRESLERAFSALLTADVALKETRLSSEEQILTTLILAMCAEDEHKIAA
jgi:DNA polymerase III subunit delta